MVRLWGSWSKGKQMSLHCSKTFVCLEHTSLFRRPKNPCSRWQDHDLPNPLSMPGSFSSFSAWFFSKHHAIGSTYFLIASVRDLVDSLNTGMHDQQKPITLEENSFLPFFLCVCMGKVIMVPVLSKCIICCHFHKITPRHLIFFWPIWSVDGDAWCPLFTWATHKCIVFNMKAFSSLAHTSKNPICTVISYPLKQPPILMKKWSGIWQNFGEHVSKSVAVFSRWRHTKVDFLHLMECFKIPWIK